MRVGLRSPSCSTGTHSAPAAAAVLPLPRVASSSATGSSFGSGWSALLVMTPSPVLASAAGLGWRGGGGWRRTRWRCCSIWSRPTSAVTERPHRVSNRSWVSRDARDPRWLRWRIGRESNLGLAAAEPAAMVSDDRADLHVRLHPHPAHTCQFASRGDPGHLVRNQKQRVTGELFEHAP